MTITIDIRTRYQDADGVAYRLFPGEGYRHYTVMRDRSVIFLDNPGIGFPGPDGYQRSSAQLESIVRSEYRRKIVHRGGDRLFPDLAQLEERDLSNARWSTNRIRSLNRLNRLYFEVPIGAAVVLPCPLYRIWDKDGELYEPTTLLGEVTGQPQILSEGAPEKILAGHYLARPVRWISEVDERYLPREVYRALRTESPFVALQASFASQALGTGYNNMTIGDEFFARFTTTSTRFSPIENFHFTAFVVAIAAALQSRIVGGAVSIGERSIYDIASRFSEFEGLEQDVSIHSPGYTTLRAKSVLPIVISVLYALATTTTAEKIYSDSTPNEIRIVNSVSGTEHPCELEIAESVNGALDIMGKRRWQEQACPAAILAKQNAGMQSAATINNNEVGGN